MNKQAINNGAGSTEKAKDFRADVLFEGETAAALNELKAILEPKSKNRGFLMNLIIRLAPVELRRAKAKQAKAGR